MSRAGRVDVDAERVVESEGLAMARWHRRDVAAAMRSQRVSRRPLVGRALRAAVVLTVAGWLMSQASSAGSGVEALVQKAITGARCDAE